jgi:hypothetical protein
MRSLILGKIVREAVEAFQVIQGVGDRLFSVANREARLGLQPPDLAFDLGILGSVLFSSR